MAAESSVFLFMKEFDYSKYDSESRAQLQFIHLKEAIGLLEKSVGELEVRVKVLEEARKRQIEINTQLLDKKIQEVSPKPEGKKSLLDLFWRK